jgi:DNA-binding MarR family transcriptional regulator/GNAT superfamily N-acetyltransferase
VSREEAEADRRHPCLWKRCADTCFGKHLVYFANYKPPELPRADRGGSHDATLGSYVTMHDAETVRRIEAVRRFSRFYTRRIGLLDEGLLDSPFTLAEGRVIYELAHHERTTATHLAEELRIDAGYLSRLTRKLQRRGVLAKRPDDEDGRRSWLSLTESGQDAFGQLNTASRSEIGTMLDELSVEAQERLVHAMSTIEGILGAAPEHRVPYILRPHQSGDMGWVVQRQALLYANEYGWDDEFEALCAEIVAHFIRHLDAKKERCWIAEKEGENVGSVFLARHPDRDGVAKLRLLFVEPQARGLGIGRRLVQECTRFARRAGYHTITLWTNSVLDAARAIYESEGYVLVEEEAHHSFGHDLIGQHWELAL